MNLLIKNSFILIIKINLLLIHAFIYYSFMHPVTHLFTYSFLHQLMIKTFLPRYSLRNPPTTQVGIMVNVCRLAEQIHDDDDDDDDDDVDDGDYN